MGQFKGVGVAVGGGWDGTESRDEVQHISMPPSYKWGLLVKRERGLGGPVLFSLWCIFVC